MLYKVSGDILYTFESSDRTQAACIGAPPCPTMLNVAPVKKEKQVPGICLVGFMGAGKSTVGRILARKLGWRFTDLDDVIETRERRRIAEIFRDAGEPAFRQAEHAALRELLRSPREAPLILALGGGAFAQAENVVLLRQVGWPVVFLDASLEELRRRCALQDSERPLFRDEHQFRRLYEVRRPYYKEADFRIETAGLTEEETAAEVARRLGWERIGNVGE